ncbi:SDR family oxidoreductase [Marinomonas balearica]|uniref:Short-subunit dehydrogenase n=1 Tax=Marinomonas balearica TaxID=491947 RepID=A0A4R6MB88_9GAMM|nr:SDR family oxidoreductase [Marinomonas balearica]TDO98714.1 short-subunit dehydrogenase [Marinomonas balearica]
MNWQSKRALLTGASGGIGQAIARELAEKGVSLILVGRNQKKLEALMRQLSGEGHHIIVADIATTTGLESVVSYVEQWGGLNMLINNAGVSHLSMLEDMDHKEIPRIISTNLIAPMSLTHALMPTFKQSSEASIINIGSAFGSIGFAGQTAYCASKFGMRGFSESLYRELADTQIEVFYLAPRATSTNINSSTAMAMNEELGNHIDSPDLVAKCLVEQLQNKKPRCFIGFPERIFVKLNGAFPHIVDKALFKKLPIIKRFICS